jgi:hypothetical protein
VQLEIERDQERGARLAGLFAVRAADEPRDEQREADA